MNKFVIALMVSVAGMLGMGATASAAPEYPPTAGTVTLTPTSPGPGDTFTATFEGCTDGEQVSFVFNGATTTATCADGSASASLTAPSNPGAYPGTVTGGTSGATGSFSIAIPDDELPATGAADVSTLLVLAFGLLAVGGGMFGVSQMRRRRDLTS